MNICTCVLYHEVLVYGVRHIRNRRTARRVYGGVHECGCTCVQIYAASVVEIRSTLNSLEFESRGGSVLLSKGLQRVTLV